MIKTIACLRALWLVGKQKLWEGKKLRLVINHAKPLHTKTTKQECKSIFIILSGLFFNRVVQFTYFAVEHFDNMEKIHQCSSTMLYRLAGPKTFAL